ncbi:MULTISPECIES: hypothetical protein [unclassified Nocardioides]|uniref:hypothetical protein n=1 Tax=unclassified Nocardioides TaxID=2615069 RepID=UPI000703B3F1|nr:MULTISPECIES: hypothetical protein [unclassified Nocardioides]KRC49025.1 hypothetical protein ASE19_19245 [Nocardioides sp. Root79]KRC75426.1 hypothetical protein ASE20_21150 [Nocardioides sp. Root240]
MDRTPDLSLPIPETPADPAFVAQLALEARASVPGSGTAPAVAPRGWMAAVAAAAAVAVVAGGAVALTGLGRDDEPEPLPSTSITPSDDASSTDATTPRDDPDGSRGPEDTSSAPVADDPAPGSVGRTDDAGEAQGSTGDDHGGRAGDEATDDSGHHGSDDSTDSGSGSDSGSDSDGGGGRDQASDTPDTPETTDDSGHHGGDSGRDSGSGGTSGSTDGTDAAAPAGA